MTRALTAGAFYGLILAGVLLGALTAGLGARAYLRQGENRPEAPRIWGDVAADLVIPLAAMMGATFGGLAGVATAVMVDRAARVHSDASTPPTR